MSTRGRGRGGRGRGGRGGTGAKSTTDQKRVPRIKAIGKGLVKGVPSGDSLILISGGQKPGAVPPEREVTISGVVAPKLARNKNQEDQAWAWHSREFLRKLVLGRTVSYQVVHHHERDGRSRDYCNINFDEKDLASVLVANGWATVQDKGGDPEKKIHPEKQKLIDLQKQAEQKQLGLHNKQGAQSDKIRFFPTVNAIDLLEKFRNVPLPALVDKVIDGSNLRIELLGDESDPLKHFLVNLRLAGVECEQTPMPIMGSFETKKSAPPNWGDKKEEDDENEDADDEEEQENEEFDSLPPQKAQKPKPYSIEAQKFVEQRLLHRDVKVLLQGADGNHPQANLFGTIVFEKGDITHRLLEQGLGRYVKWSALLTGNAEKLAAAEALAKKNRQCLHAKSAPSQSTDEKGPREFTAKVTQVISGDRVAVEIEDERGGSSGEEKRFPLASIRCARLGIRGGANEDWALDAREWLRQRVLGKKVRVVIEYEREPLPEAADQTKQPYVSLYVNKQNINEGLVINGLAKLQPHRRNEDRAENWDRLVSAEYKAQKAQAGLHGHSKPTLSSAIVDLTGYSGSRGGGGRGRGGGGRGGPVYRPVGDKTEEEDTKEHTSSGPSRARLHLVTLQRSPQQALVEYVFSGSRFKLWIQDQKLICFFVLAGIRTPRNDDNSPNEWTNKSTEYVRQRLLQKTITVETFNLDYSEVNFVGNVLYNNGQNLSIDLLREGLAMVWDNSAHSLADEGKSYYAAQEIAKEAKIGLWRDYVEPPEEEYQEYQGDDEYYEEKTQHYNNNDNEEEAEIEAARLALGADVRVKVTEIVDACTFYVHVVDDANVTLVEDALKNFTDDGKQIDEKELKSGKVYAGLFESDGTWHRVRLENKSSTTQIRGLFIDYGNREVLEISNLRYLDEDLSRVPPTAHQMFLAALKAPPEGSDYFEPAGQAFSDLVWDRELMAHVELIDAGKYHVTLTIPGSEITINQLLLESAWVRVHSRPPWKLKEKSRGEYTPLYKKILEFEAVGKNTRKHIWEYGDVSDEEEDSRDDRGRVPSKKAKEKEAKDKEEKKAKEKEKEKKKAETKPKSDGKAKGGKDKGGEKGADKGGDKGKGAAAPAKGGKKK